MNTAKRALSMASVALLVSAIPLQALANPLTPSYYWGNWEGAKFATDLAAPREIIGPLHPAFYAARIDYSKWLGTKSGSARMIAEVRNPLHPHYYWH